MSLQFSKFVKITNRGTYTSAKRARLFVEQREIAVPSEYTGAQCSGIQMLEAAEIAMLQSAMRQRNEDRDVAGSFSWMVADSGGSRLMKQYEGISGGHRVLQAEHDNRN